MAGMLRGVSLAHSLVSLSQEANGIKRQYKGVLLLTELAHGFLILLGIILYRIRKIQGRLHPYLSRSHHAFYLYFPSWPSYYAFNY